MTSVTPQYKFGLRTATVLCAGLLAIGLIVEELGWLSPFNELEHPGSVLSVFIEERYLRDPDYGLLNHREQRGRDWEHPAVMSYYEDGVLKFVSNVGLRMHGGMSRRREGELHVRLYFRRDYGSAEFRPGTIFGGRRNPITRLIVRKSLIPCHRYPCTDWPDFYTTNALAYDIAHQVGAIAPETHPVSFVLNGQPLGLYELTEPIRRSFLESRFGHGNFERADLDFNRLVHDRQRPAGLDDLELPDPWQRQSFLGMLEELKGGGPRPHYLTLAYASRWIDVESLTRWFVSVVFCATEDPFQATVFRDRTRSDSLWFWVNWDMDHSFINMWGPASDSWLHDTFRITLENLEEHHVEAYLIRRLLAEDPAYRDYLVREFLDALNYRLTPAFLDERYRHYRAIAERFGLGDKPYLEILENFLEFRSAHVREQLVRELNLAPLRQVRIEAPREATFRIDGHVVTPGFSGWYVPGMEIRVGIEGQGGSFSHWIVDGRRILSPELRLQIEEDVVIEAEFRS